jgi:hypothetical protein
MTRSRGQVSRIKIDLRMTKKGSGRLTRHCRSRGQVSRIKIDLRMTLKEIGDAAGGVDYNAVSDRVRRYERAGVVVSEMEKQIYSILNLET